MTTTEMLTVVDFLCGRYYGPLAARGTPPQQVAQLVWETLEETAAESRRGLTPQETALVTALRAGLLDATIAGRLGYC